jgi:hypothetical protein
MIQKPKQPNAHFVHGFTTRKRLQVPNSNGQMLAVMKLSLSNRAAFEIAHEALNLLL